MKQWLVTGVVCLLTACVQAPPQMGLSDLTEKPAEKALLAGVRLYDDGQYTSAERELQKALAAGFTVKKDEAIAFKYLAFIYCTSNRMDACEEAFRRAFQVNPDFALSKSEAGHPQWGPVYQKVVNARKR